MTDKLETVKASLTVINARLSHADKDLASKLWRVECRHGRVHTVSLQGDAEEASPAKDSNQVDANGSLMLPSLCHSHIHLDKCFILDRCNVVSGEFAEALEITSKAKAAFPLDLADLYDRGARLIRESVECGVTSMRAHVEVDKVVGFSCLDVAQALRSNFSSICDIQIAVFAQEPLFDASGDTKPGLNFDLLQEALQREGISVIGSAPYVEPTLEQAKSNIALIMAAAREHDAHVDFHLDYNLDLNSEPLVYEVISQARQHLEWWTRRREDPSQACRRITIGHATRLQLFTPEEWQHLAEAMKNLPITFVALPQSDIYMQGRDDYEKPLGAPRSTLRVPYLLNKYGIEVAMSVNNVQNAFTPQGSLDPLSLCSLGIGLFQTATLADIETLVRSVTSISKLVLGEGRTRQGLFPAPGDPADFVILQGADTLRSTVLHPPFDRTTIRAGTVVARSHHKTASSLDS
ncbi:putative metallo-dependent hydrolase [Lyophyllum shimeji]|uniref:Metallo-dependent hydrolase n=1 Tax=Lyophyllum shimeji TaxID=47721 RepID=A0A9P3PN11_LYOSH|nr:putative metallo-dependent hydrolase [Lyophyllum shimeji]